MTHFFKPLLPIVRCTLIGLLLVGTNTNTVRKIPAAVANEPAAEAETEALATGDFSIRLKIKLPERFTADSGNLVTLWDTRSRHGFTLSVVNQIGTSGQANRRQLQFGIDAGTTPQWREEGRPGEAVLAFGLATHQGQLYAATVEGGADPTGKVYRYEGPGNWQSLGSPDVATGRDGPNAITALASFAGDLYAGTGKYRLGGSALRESENNTLGGRVYRLISPDQWQLVGQLSETEAISSLAEYDGHLYASSLYRPAGFFRYDGGTEWTRLPLADGSRVNALAVHGGFLYGTSYDNGQVFRFDGQNWQTMGMVDDDITQNYSFATWDNALHVGTWPTGKVYRLADDGRWIDCGRLGQETEVMAMMVHNGSFYAGTLPLAEVYRYHGDTDWQRLKAIDATPDVQYRRVWTMANYQGRLFASTLPSGQIWSMTTGAMVTYDEELSDGWHEILACRQDGELQLWVDGKLVGRQADGGLSLQTSGLSLRIGSGPRGAFSGEIKDVTFRRGPSD